MFPPRQTFALQLESASTIERRLGRMFSSNPLCIDYACLEIKQQGGRAKAVLACLETKQQGGRAKAVLACLETSTKGHVNTVLKK